VKVIVYVVDFAHYVQYLLLWQVTAAKRPKNSALEVDLDFEHNMKPPPAVTEELTASLEDLIKKRIIEVNPKFKRHKLFLSTQLFLPINLTLDLLTV